MYAIYGKARVGEAVARLAESLGVSVRIFDDADPDFRASDFEAVIPSPGVCPTNRAFDGNNVVGELDFAYRYLPKGFKIIAVTGTDGKSTIAWMIYSILREAFGEERVFLSGNFEIPFSETVKTIRERSLESGYIVLEVSSFMAQSIGSFHADVTVFSNFQRDHLNWHGSMENYWKAKMNLVAHTEQAVIAHGSLRKNENEFPKGITKWYGTGDRTFDLSGMPFHGEHNAQNALAATLAANELGIPDGQARAALAKTASLPHRLELVKVKNWISYIDDSKSTSAQSLEVALRSFPKSSVCLIAGGSDKWDEFHRLKELFSSQVKFVAAIGATKKAFAELAQDSGVPFVLAESMLEAVESCQKHAKEGDVVLLSPGCASFGMFRDYLHRAEEFRKAVWKLTV